MSKHNDPLMEAIDAISDGVVIFGRDMKLVFANASFRQHNPAIADFLAQGTLWDIFLLEASLRGAISQTARAQLELMEIQLTQGSTAPLSINNMSNQERSSTLTLRAASDDGLILTQSFGAHPMDAFEEASQADVLLAKVLEACPVNLTMSRVGDGSVIYRSPAATEMLGKSKNSLEHFARREERADFITELLPIGRVDDKRIIGLKPGGIEYPASISARLIEYHDEEVIVSTISDLSDEIAMQAKLAQQREQLFQAEKMSALGELLAGIAHELNNPLSVVVGNAMMMKEDIEDPNLTKRVDKISDAAERCVRIVKSFLATARKEPLELVAVDLDEIFATVLEAMDAQDLQNNISIEQLPFSFEALVLVDPVQICQVLINLVTNAHQAMSEAEIGDDILLSAHLDPAGDTISIEVSDNGPGVPKNVENKIFDPLFTTKKVGQGTGIGLAFCHRIVTAHDGTISLKSDNKQGATFTVTLPVWRGRT